MTTSRTVVLSAFPDHGVWYGIIQGVQAYTEEHGCWHLCFTSPLALPEALRGWRSVAGLIGYLPDRATVARALRRGTHVVSTVNLDIGLSLPVVCQDDLAIGRMAAKEFLSRGYRRFGVYVSGPFAYAALRRRGFVEAVELAGHRCEVYVRPGSGPRMHAPYLAFDARLVAWVKSLPKPVALFSDGEVFAQHLVMACEHTGVRVPEEAAVIGVDNDEVLCTLSHPPLASVHTPGRPIGYTAARLLDGLLRGRPEPARPVLIKPLRVVVRRSCDATMVDNPAVAAALRYLRGHAHEPVGIKNLQAAAGAISGRTLHRRFVEELGHGPGEALIRIRLERARHLLADTSLTVEEIARRCGWQNGRTMSALFARRTGFTPGAFRAQAREDALGTDFRPGDGPPQGGTRA